MLGPRHAVHQKTSLLPEDLPWIPIRRQMERGQHRRLAARDIAVKIQTMHMHEVHRMVLENFSDKAPMCAPELYPEHDLFIQLMKLKNTLRWMMGEDLITHLGQEYYD